MVHRHAALEPSANGALMPITDKKTFSLAEFDGGIDVRNGVYDENANRFATLDNLYVTVGKSLKRRPPCIKLSGSIDAQTKGLVQLKGQFYVFAKKGDTIAHTIAGVTINTLYFDNPDYCTTWTVVQSLVFNNVVVALIKHTFPGTTVTSRILLHVFDSKTNKPTYVEDPYCPTNWNPSFPLHVYRTGVAGAFDSSFTPVMGVGGSKLWISRPDGNVHCSKINNPRFWNNRDYTSLMNYGEWWYFVAPAGAAGIYNFVVSESFADTTGFGKWTAYVLEYLDSTGTWQKFVEDYGVPAVDGHYYPETVASRFAGGPNEIKVRAYMAAPADRILRFRMIAGDAPYTTTGITYYPYRTNVFTGTGAQVAFQTSLVDGPQFGTDALRVYVAGVLQAYPAAYTVTYVGGLALITFAVAPGAAARIAVIQSAQWIVPPGATYTYEGAVNSAFTRNAVSAQVFDSTIPFPASVFIGCLAQFQSGNGFVNFIAERTNATVNPVNGYERYIYKVVSYGITNAIAPNEFTASGLWIYGNTVGSQTQFYVDKLFDYTVNQAGAGEATYLATSNYAAQGGTIKAIIGINNRMVFIYQDDSELWSVFPNPADCRFQSNLLFGCGSTELTPKPILFNPQYAIIPTATGVRGLSMVPGNNTDSLQDNNLGEPLIDVVLPTQSAAAYWPFLGCYVTAGALAGASQLYVYNYSKESKIAAWSRWLPTSIATVDGLFDRQDRLYVLSGTSLYYFDAAKAVTSFRDTNDGATAYQSKATWHFNDLKKPGTYKQFLNFDCIQSGLATWSFLFSPNDLTVVSDSFPVERTTYGDGRIPLGQMSHAIAAQFTSVDDTGFELDQIAIDYRYLSR
jgi:hypothetical protein